MNIETVGVVGAGVMGSGVAQALAQTGHQVILVDLVQETLESASRRIGRAVRVQNLFDAEADHEGPEVILDRIAFTTDLQELQDSDFVVENITEDLALKEPVYRKLDAICPSHVVFAADTSAIPIRQLAAFTGRPAKVLGIHFMNPVPLKPVVELIRAEQTSQESIDTAVQLLSQMGKEGILVNDAPGFVSNRVLMLTINEAINLVDEGVAAPAAVDQIFKKCFGHKMGPLETGDLIGLDTILLTLNVLYDNFDDNKFLPSPLLETMVADGRLGQKSGQGFYSYGGGY